MKTETKLLKALERFSQIETHEDGYGISTVCLDCVEKAMYDHFKRDKTISKNRIRRFIRDVIDGKICLDCGVLISKHKGEHK